MAITFTSDVSDFTKGFVASICNSYQIKDAEEVSVQWLRYSKSTPKGCYENARKYVMQYPESQYILGYMFYNGTIPIEHAWIRKEGVDYDITVKPEATNLYVACVSLNIKDLISVINASSVKSAAFYDYFRAKTLGKLSK